MQATLLRRRLLRWIGPDPVDSVLDVGCGLGDLAAALAPQARRITAVDRSPAMVDFAGQALAGCGAQVDLSLWDLENGLDDHGIHDLVVAHNVVDYTADPRLSIERVIGCVRPGGRFSLSFGNGAAHALRHAVMTQDLDEALELARRGEVGRLPGPCGPSARLRRLDVETWLEALGMSVTHRAGVRVLVDLLPSELQTAATMASIEELEMLLGERPELVDVGALVHVFGTRP